jgi:hypothetical protein
LPYTRLSVLHGRYCPYTLEAKPEPGPRESPGQTIVPAEGGLAVQAVRTQAVPVRYIPFPSSHSPAAENPSMADRLRIK